MRASNGGFPAWTGSCGTMGRAGLRSPANAPVGNRARVLLSPAQAGRHGGGSLLADEFPLLYRGSSGSISHGQEPLGDRKPRLQRSQEPSWPRAYLSSSCQQSADRLAPGHVGLDHRTTLPPALPPPWQTSVAQQCPAAAPTVAHSFPTASRQQQLMPSRRKCLLLPIRPLPISSSLFRGVTSREQICLKIGEVHYTS